MRLACMGNRGWWLAGPVSLGWSAGPAWMAAGVTEMVSRPAAAGMVSQASVAGGADVVGVAGDLDRHDVPGMADVVRRVAGFPRLRYMGSKYRLVPQLAEVFTALDAFSGSGVVSYLLKVLGYQVTANDFLTFPGVIASATVVNHGVTLAAADIDAICGPAADDRDFVQRNFRGVYFTDADRRFLDSAWSHIDRMDGHKRAIAIAALVLAAARRVQQRRVRQRPAVRRRPRGRLRHRAAALRRRLPRSAVRAGQGRQLLH